MNLGFIGVGVMGKHLATNLLRAGQPLRVWNRESAPVDELVAKGAQRAATPAEAAQVDVLFSMLADDNVVRSVIIDGGALAAMAPGSIHVNMATVSPDCAREMAARHAERGVGYVSAPVLGRPDLAAAAKLNIVAAGPDGLIDKVQPLLDLLGQKTWRFGEVQERANAVKLGSNLTLALAVEAMGEASALVHAYGVPPASFLDMLSQTLYAGSPVYKGYGELIAQERYRPAGFKLSLALKDVQLALQAAQEKALSLAAGNAVRQNLLEAAREGDADADLAALAKLAGRTVK